MYEDRQQTINATTPYNCPAEICKTIDTVFAPLMAAFVAWIIDEASKDGIKTLFFLSRDAYPAFVLADYLCKEKGSAIECRYFFCSRFSLRMPMYSENLDEAIDYIFRSGIDINTRKLIKRAGLYDKELPPKTATELQRHAKKGTLTRTDLLHLKECLKKDREFLEHVSINSEQAWPAIAGYFKQEGMLNNDIGIVDSGWTGTTQKSINQIRKRCGTSKPVIGYYLGLYDLPADVDSTQYKSFYFSPEGDAVKKAFFSNCLLEAVLSSKDHGTTIGYYKASSKYEPLFADASEDETAKYINKRIIDSALMIIKDEEYKTPEFKQLFISGWPFKNKLSLLAWHPTNKEAEILGSLPFSDDLLDDTTKQLAPIMGRSELWGNHLFARVFAKIGLRKKPISESGWYEGSAVRSSLHPQYHRYSFLLFKVVSANAQIRKYKKRLKKGHYHK